MSMSMEDTDSQVSDSALFDLNSHTPNRRMKKAKSKNQKEKARTPSGQVLNTSVKDIRNFLLNDTRLNRSRNLPNSLKDSHHVSDYSCMSDSPVQSAEQLSQLNTKQTRKSVNHEITTIQPQTEEACEHDTIGAKWNFVNKNKSRKSAKPKQDKDNKTLSVGSLSNRFSQLASNSDVSSIEDSDCDNSNSHIIKGLKVNRRIFSTSEVEAESDYLNEATYPIFSQTKSGMAQSSDFTNKDQINTEVENKIRSMADPVNPQLMDIQVVIKMFSELKREIADMKNLNGQSAENADSLQLEDSSQMKKEFQEYKLKTDLLFSIVERLGCVTTELLNRIDTMEMRGMRKSIVIGGLKTDNRILKCIQQIEAFILNELGMETTIIDCFKLGFGENKPVVITVDSLQQKIKLFQSMDKYRKGKKLLKEDITVYLSDFLPPESKETKRREREIFKKNEQDQSTGIDMNLTKNGLEIQGTQFVRKVTAPDSTKILSYQEEHLNKICNMKLMGGDELVEKGSKFIGYVLPTNNHALINDAYMKLRLIFPQAKHIICAYSIPGLPRCLHEDYCDDKETGGGNFLSKLLQKNSITCMAFFVIRIQEGPNIGPTRFEIMEMAVRNALQKNPFNKYVNANQVITTEQFKATDRTVKTHVQGKYQRGNPPIRGNITRGAFNESTKRRRQDSDNPGFRFPPPIPYNSNTGTFQFVGATDQTMNSRLGDSWPTLNQATGKWS